MKRKLHTQEVSGSVLMEKGNYGELAYRLTQLIGMQLLNNHEVKYFNKQMRIHSFGKKILYAAVGCVFFNNFSSHVF